MSLYDKYFSKINEDHMYDLITKIIIDETGQNIKNNNKYYQIYKNNYPIIFDKINAETIIDLNKELLDVVSDIIMKDITKNYKLQNIQNIQNIQIIQNI